MHEHDNPVCLCACMSDEVENVPLSLCCQHPGITDHCPSLFDGVDNTDTLENGRGLAALARAVVSMLHFMSGRWH